MSFGFCMVILTILLCAGTFGLPPLMDGARCSIYYAYLLSGVPVLLLDGIVCLFFRAKKVRLWRNLVSFAVSAAVLTGFFQSGLLKTPGYDSGYVTNGARTCLTNIIKENEDETWTIVSANDETQMGLDHGWHYETITFLRKQENCRRTPALSFLPERYISLLKRFHWIIPYLMRKAVSPFPKKAPVRDCQIPVESACIREKGAGF